MGGDGYVSLQQCPPKKAVEKGVSRVRECTGTNGDKSLNSQLCCHMHVSVRLAFLAERSLLAS